MKKKASCGSGNGNRAQTRQYRVFSFGDRLRVSRFVSEAFATETFQRRLGARHVVYAQPFAVAVAEVEFGQIPMQVGFADMELAAGDAPLEDAEIVLDGIGVRVAADVFAPLVTYHFMVEISRHVAVLARVVGVQLRLLVNLAHQDRPQIGCGNAGDMHRADAAVALHQREHGFLAPTSAKTALGVFAAMAVLFLAAYEGFVRLYRLAFAAQGINRSVLHRFADAMGQEPCSLHAALEHPLNLAGRDSLLAGAHQMDHLQPQVQGKVRRLEDSPDPNSERLPAGVALVQALAGGLTIQLADMIAGCTTERTVGTIGPKVSFDIRESRILIVEMRGG